MFRLSLLRHLHLFHFAFRQHNLLQHKHGIPGLFPIAHNACGVQLLYRAQLPCLGSYVQRTYDSCLTNNFNMLLTGGELDVGEHGPKGLYHHVYNPVCDIMSAVFYGPGGLEEG